MRIVHLITRLVHGGAQINTILTAAHQAQQGHQVVLASGPQTGPEGSLWAYARDLGTEPLLLPHLLREVHPVADLRAFVEIVRLLRRVRPHVVHTHTSKAGLLGRWAAWWVGVPIVVHTPHGHVFHGYFSSPATALFTLLERLTAPITDRLVMLTEAERQEHLAARVGRADQFVVVPSGVTLQPLAGAPPTRDALGLPPDGGLVACVARLAPVKGVLDLVEAFPRVVRRHPSAHLALVGDGPQRAEIEARIAHLGLGDHVTLLGRLDRPEPVLAVADLLVVPSRNEGMGRVAVEGMASGLPVVATRIGGLQEVVGEGETGLLVEPGDPSALADAIADLLADPARRREMGRAGRHRAERYGTHVMLGLLEALYHDLGAHLLAD